ncbi:hypothetical protein MIS33_03665 [Wielerella bovis]|uniref:hypothetical protein n=1 Tax=Wielerella bovis TaxID=2917790 RepID=UPI002019D248|nr:hypothetical protein [Wielerella bovis]ULJ65380.1 hypothetical protein MIS33_03665 [Wielerella bovis]
MSDSLAYIVPKVVYLENAQEKIDQIHAQFVARGWIEDELAEPLFEENAVAYALTEKGIAYFADETGHLEFKHQYSAVEFHVFDEPKAYGFAEGSEFDETDCPHCQAHYYCDYDGFDEEDWLIEQRLYCDDGSDEEDGEGKSNPEQTEETEETDRLQFIDLLDTLDTTTGQFTCLQCGQSELISRFTYQYGNVFACSNVAVAFAGIGTDMIPSAVKQEIQEILGVECALVDERI